MKSTNPLLLLVLLAVLLQPVVLVMLLDREEPAAPPAPRPDPELALAMRDLARALSRVETVPAAVASPPTSPAAAPGSTDPARSPVRGRIPPPPQTEGSPAGRKLVNAWIAHHHRLEEVEKRLPKNLFFGRSTAQILAEFGTPDEAYENTASVIWVYRGPDDQDSMYVSIYDGLVYRAEVH